MVVEEDGVAIGDWVASLSFEGPWDGDDVPSFESFLDLEDLGSFARESCSCWIG